MEEVENRYRDNDAEAAVENESRGEGTEHSGDDVDNVAGEQTMVDIGKRLGHHTPTTTD